jgi:hypothetical protein
MGMNRFEWFWWWLTRKIPKRFGKRIRVGYFYDRYYNKDTKETWAFDKQAGKMLPDD